MASAYFLLYLFYTKQMDKRKSNSLYAIIILSVLMESQKQTITIASPFNRILFNLYQKKEKHGCYAG